MFMLTRSSLALVEQVIAIAGLMSMCACGPDIGSASCLDVVTPSPTVLDFSRVEVGAKVVRFAVLEVPQCADLEFRIVLSSGARAAEALGITFRVEVDAIGTLLVVCVEPRLQGELEAVLEVRTIVGEVLSSTLPLVTVRAEAVGST